jgi:hypothetical protein
VGDLALRERCPDAFGHDHGPVGVGVGQQEGDLLAAVAGCHVALPHAVAQQLTRHLQHPIAAEVAVGVVDLLEVIDVAHHERERRPVATRPGQLDLAGEHQVAPVLERGERVGRRDLLETQVLLVQFRLQAAQLEVNPDAGEQLLVVEWLGEIVGSAGLQGPHLLAHVGGPRQHDDRDISQLGSRLLQRQKAEPVEPGHHHVAQDQIDRLRGELLEAIEPVTREDIRQLGGSLAQHALGVMPDGLRVVDEQHFTRIGHD